jgi:hypothetical protein
MTIYLVVQEAIGCGGGGVAARAWPRSTVNFGDSVD